MKILKMFLATLSAPSFWQKLAKIIISYEIFLYFIFYFFSLSKLPENLMLAILFKWN